MTTLRVVPSNPETVADRVRRLQSEARDLAAQHIGELQRLLESASDLAAEIAEGGEAYPPGVRDLARRFSEELPIRRATIGAIMGRSR